MNIQMDGERFSNYPSVNAGLLAGAKADNKEQKAHEFAGRTTIADWDSYTRDFHIVHNHDGVHYKAGAFLRRMNIYAAVLSDDPAVDKFTLTP